MSKNYQIKYSIKADDLTAAGVSRAIANLKRLADAQKKIDKERIENRHKVLAKLHAEKQLKQNEQLSKQENRADLARYRQLLGRKALMEKVHALRKLKGDEDGLRKYRRTQEGILTKLQNKFFEKGDYKGRAANLAEQLTVQGRLNRSEFMLGSAISANNRKREQALRLQERQAKQAERLQQQFRERGQQAQIAAGVASGAALYGGAKASGYALKEAMTMEQLSIAMRAQFGEKEGNMVLKEMKDYSLQTMFKLEDTIQMLLGIRKAGANIGLTTTAQQVAFAKALGKPLLAYATNKERRAEAGYQLEQIFQAGTADERQDVKVIARSGIPIYAALKNMTGKSYDQLQEIYGKQLPAHLIAKAMIYLGTSEATMKAMLEYEKSLTISVEAASEQLGWTAAAFGDTIAKALKIPTVLRALTKGMGEVEEKLKSGQVSGLASYAYIVSGLTLGFMSLNGIIMAGYVAMKYFAGSTLAANMGLGGMSLIMTSLLSKFALFAGISSLIYLGLADWKGLFDDFNKQGFSGVLKHMDMLMAALSTLGAGAIAGGAVGGIWGAFIGMAAAAAGVGAIGLGNMAFEAIDDQLWRDARKEFNPNNPTMPLGSIPQMSPIPDKKYVQPSIDETLKSMGLTIINNNDPVTGKIQNKVFINNNPVYTGFGQ